jgi:hypothetical protein
MVRTLVIGLFFLLVSRLAASEADLRAYLDAYTRESFEISVRAFESSSQWLTRLKTNDIGRNMETDDNRNKLVVLASYMERDHEAVKDFIAASGGSLRNKMLSKLDPEEDETKGIAQLDELIRNNYLKNFMAFSSNPKLVDLYFEIHSEDVGDKETVQKIYSDFAASDLANNRRAVTGFYNWIKSADLSPIDGEKSLNYKLKNLQSFKKKLEAMDGTLDEKLDQLDKPKGKRHAFDETFSEELFNAVREFVNFDKAKIYFENRP